MGSYETRNGERFYVRKGESSDDAYKRHQSAKDDEIQKKNTTPAAALDIHDFNDANANYTYNTGVAAKTEEYYKQYGLYDAYAKYGKIDVQFKLPQLEGSEKQVKWAEDIRNNAISNDIERMAKNYKINEAWTDDARTKAKREKTDALIADCQRRADSGGGKAKVRSLSDAVTYAIKANPNSAYNKFKKMTSAKEIIDNR